MTIGPDWVKKPKTTSLARTSGNLIDRIRLLFTESCLGLDVRCPAKPEAV
jgi:hypothetical protein